MTIAQHKVVSIHYKVSDTASSEVIDSTEDGDPMTYLHGAQNIIPGLEQALEGKQVGDEIEVTVLEPGGDQKGQGSCRRRLRRRTKHLHRGSA